MIKCKVLAVGAWLASLVWFAVVTWVFIGFTPFSFLAWAVPAWMLFRRTTRWWDEAGSPLKEAVLVWLQRAWLGLAATVVGMAGLLTLLPAMSSEPTTYDSVLKGVAVICLLFPPAVVAWVVFCSVRISRPAA